MLICFTPLNNLEAGRVLYSTVSQCAADAVTDKHCINWTIMSRDYESITSAIVNAKAKKHLSYVVPRHYSASLPRSFRSVFCQTSLFNASHLMVSVGGRRSNYQMNI